MNIASFNCCESVTPTHIVQQTGKPHEEGFALDKRTEYLYFKDFSKALYTALVIIHAFQQY